MLYVQQYQVTTPASNFSYNNNKSNSSENNILSIQFSYKTNSETAEQTTSQLALSEHTA
jgi:hypothetical protein